jgi:hypothetical protein
MSVEKVNHDKILTLHGEEIAGLKESQKSIVITLNRMDSAVQRIEQNFATRSQTNWVTIFTGLGVLLTMGAMFWAAMINPINKDVERTNKDSDRNFSVAAKSAETLALAVQEQNKVIARQELDIARLGMQLQVNTEEIKDTNPRGPSAFRRP